MNQKAFWAVLLAATLAGSAGLFIKNISINSASQAWMRMGIPTVVMGTWMLIDGVPFFRGNWKKMLFASGLGTIRMVFFFAAYIYTSIGNAVIIFYTFPIFAAILSSYYLKEEISNRQKILLLVAFAGIVLAFSNKDFSFENRDFLGMSAALLASIIYASTVVIFKSESKNYSLNELVFYQNFAGLFLLAPFFEFSKATPNDFLLGISYSLLIGVFVFSLFFFGLKRLKASTASALMYMEVVSAVILGYFVLGEALSPQMIIGGAMIIGSSFLLGQGK